MPRYSKDEMNFHKFLNAMRDFHEVTLEQICEGLCTSGMMKRIECGDRLPEKQMRDRMLSRMGVMLEGYEDYLSTEEYEQWGLRQNLLRSIEKRQIEEAEKYLDEYRIYENQSTVEAQYCETMKFMILQMRNAPIEKQQEAIESAVNHTMPDIEKGLSEKRLLSEQELNLLIEYVRLCKYKGETESEFDWKCKKYEELLSYIERSHLDNYCRAKVYPKAAYYLSKLCLNESEKADTLELGIKVCNEAIELLRDSSRLYYFIELVEILEKLVEELGFYLCSENKQEELEILYASLEEKKEWRDVIMELYTEYQVSPYMEHFCYLYQEMESHCISDVIRTRRQMFGMTKEELCEGICSVKTLTRIEHKKVKTQMPIVRELFERLGLCPEYIRARVITSDYEVLKLADKFVKYENNRIIKDWIWCLKELEQRLCLEIPQNKQFIMHSNYLLELRMKELSEKEYIEKIKETLELTIPLEYVMKPGKKFLSQEEYTYIRSVGMYMDITKDNLYIQIIREICEEDENGLKVGIGTYEFLMMAVISYLGNIGAYDESDKLSNEIIKKSLIYRRQINLAESLYNNIWNYQQKVKESRYVDKTYEEESSIRKCLSLSKYNNEEKFIKFFNKMLEDYKNNN